MKAAMFYGPNRPIKIVETTFPKITDDEVLVLVKTCGICHTDLSIYKGVYSSRKNPPLILGHEIAGVVERVGNNVENHRPGDKVAVLSVLSCGKCTYCIEGLDNLCDEVKVLGIDCNGGFAEFVNVPAKNVFKIPSFLSFEQAALLSDAVATPFCALNKVKPREKSTIVIFGIGGLGMNAVQIANKVYGSRVIAVDVVKDKLLFAKSLGANELINATECNVVETIKELTDGYGADYVFEFVGSPETYVQSLKVLRRGGTAVFVGVGDFKFKVPVKRLFKEEITLTGSYATNIKGFKELLEYVKKGLIDLSKLQVKSVQLEEINQGFTILDKHMGNANRVIVKVGL